MGLNTLTLPRSLSLSIRQYFVLGTVSSVCFSACRAELSSMSSSLLFRLTERSYMYRKAKNLAHSVRLITSSNIEQFSNFFSL